MNIHFLKDKHVFRMTESIDKSFEKLSMLTFVRASMGPAFLHGWVVFPGASFEGCHRHEVVLKDPQL